MNFGRAIEELTKGNKVQRAGWNGKGMYIALQIPDTNSKMTFPYVYLKTAGDELVPWQPSQTDMLIEDWQLVE